MTALRMAVALSKTPRLEADPDEWWERALCAKLSDPDATFFEDNDADASARAKAICSHCPVLKDCGAHADRVKPAYGIFAGRLWKDGAPINRDTRKVKTSAVCGTDSGYKRHQRRQENVCDECRKARAEKDRLRADQLHPCGTQAAYFRHRRRHEQACDPCLAAWSEQIRIRKQQKAQAA